MCFLRKKNNLYEKKCIEYNVDNIYLRNASFLFK